MLEVQENEFIYFIIFCFTFFFATGFCIFILIKILLKAFNIKGNIFLICPRCRSWGTLQKKNNHIERPLDETVVSEILDYKEKETRYFVYTCSKCGHSLKL